MADDPSAIVLACATEVDGTEHFVISKSGGWASAQLNCLRDMIAAEFILPTADPHVIGALWNNAGTITISAG